MKMRFPLIRRLCKAIQMNMNEDDLSELMMSLLSSENSSYDGNLKKLGYADLNVPGGINIYPRI